MGWRATYRSTRRYTWKWGLDFERGGIIAYWSYATMLFFSKFCRTRFIWYEKRFDRSNSSRVVSGSKSDLIGTYTGAGDGKSCRNYFGTDDENQLWNRSKVFRTGIGKRNRNRRFCLNPNRYFVVKVPGWMCAAAAVSPCQQHNARNRARSSHNILPLSPTYPDE